MMAPLLGRSRERGHLGEKLRKSPLSVFEKKREKRRQRNNRKRHRGRTGFKIKQLSLLWKMNGGCCSMFRRRTETEKVLF